MAFHQRKKNPNTKKINLYIAVFVCQAVKAVHLEVVSGLKTEAFLAALRRCISRHVKCNNIYSDNAKNFERAKNKFEELQSLESEWQIKETI